MCIFKKIYFLIPSILFIPFEFVFAQQISIHYTFQNYNISSHTRTFNDRFNFTYPYYFSIDSSAVYKSKKVKNVSIFNAQNSLIFMSEFDSLGRLIKFGEGGSPLNYFRTFQKGRLINGQSYKRHEFFQNDTLKRVDSIFIGLTNITKRDTTYIYEYILNKIYKSGLLLNEQGNYYNHLKRPKLYKFKNKYDKPFNRFKKRFKNYIKYIFRNKFKTDFNDEKFYLTKESKSLHLKAVIVGNDTFKHFNHLHLTNPWTKNPNYEIYHVKCEKFKEHSYAFQSKGCATGKAQFYEEQKRKSYSKYLFNSEGLFSTLLIENNVEFRYTYSFFE